MRTFVQLNASNVVTGELQSDKVPGPGPGLPPNVIEVTNRNDGPWMGKIYNAGNDTFTAPAPTADAINPPVSRPQAASILKSLLENPPTAPNPWTQLQRDQCAYLLLLGRFQDFKGGNVY